MWGVVFTACAVFSFSFSFLYNVCAIILTTSLEQSACNMHANQSALAICLSRVGQNHIYMVYDVYIYIRCTNVMFGRDITKSTVI